MHLETLAAVAVREKVDVTSRETTCRRLEDKARGVLLQEPHASESDQEGGFVCQTTRQAYNTTLPLACNHTEILLSHLSQHEPLRFDSRNVTIERCVGHIWYWRLYRQVMPGTWSSTHIGADKHLRDDATQDCFSNKDFSGSTNHEATQSFTLMSSQSGTTVLPRSASNLERFPSSAPASPATATASSLPAPAAKPTVDLNTGVKIGIGTAVGVLVIALLIVMVEACYLRKKRRERALQRAVDEVERGIDKGSHERIVLESRVSIVFEDEEQEEEVERGRSGMSLPRRV